MGDIFDSARNRSAPLVVFVLSLLLLACGGGTGATALATAPDSGVDTGGDVNPDPGTDPGGGTVVEEVPLAVHAPLSTSYSPTRVQGSDGNPMPLLWTYRVNSDQPLAVEFEGTKGSLTFSQGLQIQVDPTQPGRVTVLPFQFTGTVPEMAGEVTGVGMVDSYEPFDESQPGPVRTSEVARNLTLSIPTPNGNRALQVIYSQTSPEFLPWFPDRSDLNTLPVGFTSEPLPMVPVQVGGTVLLSMDNASVVDAPMMHDFGFTDRWEVVDRLDSLDIAGMRFTDIVVLEHMTLVPEMRDPEPEVDSGANRVVRMWFARGVGLIKAEGLLQMYGQPIDVELTDSNLMN